MQQILTEAAVARFVNSCLHQTPTEWQIGLSINLSREGIFGEDRPVIRVMIEGGRP
jgi:hypothetical protein